MATDWQPCNKAVKSFCKESIFFYYYYYYHLVYYVYFLFNLLNHHTGQQGPTSTNLWNSISQCDRVKTKKEQWACTQWTPEAEQIFDGQNIKYLSEDVMYDCARWECLVIAINGQAPMEMHTQTQGTFISIAQLNKQLLPMVNKHWSLVAYFWKCWIVFRLFCVILCHG